MHCWKPVCCVYSFIPHSLPFWTPRVLILALKLRSCSLGFLSHQALQLIPEEEKREAALTQLNKAALALCVEQRPTQSDLLYQTWYVTIAEKSPFRQIPSLSSTGKLQKRADKCVQQYEFYQSSTCKVFYSLGIAAVQVVDPI